MRANVKKPKKKPNAKVIIGAIGAVCVIGSIGNLVDGNSSSEQASTTAYEVTSESAFDFIEETSSIKVVENETTEKATTTEAAPETSTTVETSAETTTADPTNTEVASLETTSEENSTSESTSLVETTAQVVAESTTEITTTTEAITEPPATEPATTTNVGDELVWVSETGKKYHSKNNCYPINPDNARQVTKNEAVNELGLEPCGKCYK